MKNKFTVEETNLISIYQGESRMEIIRNIDGALKYLKDEDMLELSTKAVKKLRGMSEEEFAGLEFIAAD